MKAIQKVVLFTGLIEIQMVITKPVGCRKMDKPTSKYKISSANLFLGWFTEGKCNTSDFWVLNEKAFMKSFENAKLIYKESEISHLKTQLRYWIVNHAENKII